LVERLTNEQNVDITTKPGAVGQDLLHSAKQHAQQSLLDVVVAVNGRGQRLSQEIEDALLLLGEFFALLDVLAGNGRKQLFAFLKRTVKLIS